MTIFFRELKAHRRSLIIWCFGVVAMIGSGMSKYQALSSTGQTMNDLMAKMPKPLQTIFGTGDFDLSTAIGFYGVLFLYLLIMVTIHAVMLGARIISKEETDKTAEFLFTKPISRYQVVTAKLAASIINLLILNAITLVTSIAVVSMNNHGDTTITSPIVSLMIGLFILQLLFLVIGMATAAITNRPKSAGAISTGILLVTFLLSIIMDLNNHLSALRLITPFKYVEAKQVIQGNGLDYGYLSLSLTITGILLYLTYTIYNRGDINI